MKTKPSEEKPKPSVKDINNIINKQYNDMQVKQYIIDFLNQLDEKAAGKRYPEFIKERYSGVTIQKAKSRYIIRDTNDFRNVLLSTTDRKQVEELLYNILT